MNWILTSVFLVFIFIVYNTVGSLIFRLIKIQEKNFAHKVLAGFTIISLLQWIIGFFSQLYHISWKNYMFFMIVAYILLLVIFILLTKKQKFFLKMINLKGSIFEHIKNYWLIYVVCAIFSFFSMTSQLPYLQMNYDDYYYIGRMVQEIGSNQLAIENYYMGSSDILSFDRIITTYEITYGFWSQIFGIYPSFFARATMVIHNYFMIFLSFYFVASLFIKNKKNIQYSIFVIFILLIPAGYLAGNNVIDMYDGWQFNTAIWYGGSIVRVMGIPLLLMSVFIGRNSIKYGIISFLIISTVLVSYSAIAVTTIFLFVITILVVIMIDNIIYQKKNFKKIMAILSILIITMILVALNNIDTLLPIEFTNKIQLAVDNFNMNNNSRLDKSVLLYITLFCSIMLTFISDRRQNLVVGSILFSVLFFYVPFLTYSLSVSTTGYFFVISRAFTSVQILLLLLTGIFFVKLVSDNFKKIVPIVVTSLLIIAVLFQLYHLEDYKNYVYLGSGLSESGYSVQRLVKNNYMIPKVFIDFGDYLDSQNEERYQIVAPHIIQYEGGPLELNLGMIMASNKVEMCNSYKGECFNDINQQKQIINDFLMGNIVAFEEFETIAKNYGIDFVVTNDSDVLKTLKENDYEIVVESNSLANEKVYLIDMR